jgi:hypothetical protein
MDNLYFEDWGHPFSDALGDGSAARSVREDGSAFNFSGFGPFAISATGSVQDPGTTFTGPDGSGGVFRGLTVYSMIGLWSATSDSITEIGTPFVVGSAASLGVPNAPAAYLFLAENDGIFSDNLAGQYDVTLEVELVPVPIPAALPLLLAGLAGGLALLRRRSVR